MLIFKDDFERDVLRLASVSCVASGKVAGDRFVAFEPLFAGPYCTVNEDVPVVQPCL